ncbi:MAG: cell division protein FtsQ/DivIB [Rhodanobacteraceae bacterium]
MRGSFLLKLIAWSIAITLVALPIVGVLNGWFASDRWPVTKLDVRAEFNHVSAEQLRAAVAPHLGEGFFAVNLADVRAAVAKLPWVEHAEARKHWPDAIELVVYEQQPFAHWGRGRLINRHGQVFSVAGIEGLQGLPELSGPDDRLDDVIRFHADCLKEFTGSGLIVTAVALSPRGGWTLTLASGASIAVGREEPRERLKRFLDAWPTLAAGRTEAPAYVDLRYANGFAIRWGGAAAPSAKSPGIGNRESGIGKADVAIRNPAFPFPIPYSLFPTT